jgi:uncharacterized membrane protein SirB2
MPYEFYKVLHLIGIMFLFFSVGGMVLHGMNGGTKESNGSRKWLVIGHGVSLVVILVAGFGLLARLGLTQGFPLWVWPKLAIWLAMGAVIALAYRGQAVAKALWVAIPLLGAVAAWLAIYKPGA